MNETMEIVVPALRQIEAPLTLTLPPLPRFSDLAREFLNLPDLLSGGLAKGNDPIKPNTGSHGGWGK